MTKAQIKNFLVEKRGYIKKSPIKVAKAMWKTQNILPKTHEELSKELAMIRDIQKTLRAASSYIASKEELDILDVYNDIITSRDKPKRKLFFDIEVSPNIVLTWRVGQNINLSHDSIVQERAIICICWKWADEDKVYSLQWDKGCDKSLLQKFSKVIDSADEVIGQNSDSFDIKWVRARCIFHDIPLAVKYNSIDTLKMARAQFKFNSNKLDYMSKFLGREGKIKTDFDLWRNILLFNDPKALKDMVTYCKGDVLELEEVYNKLQPYCPVKKFKYKP